MNERFDIILTSWNRLDYLKHTVASLINSNAIADCERFIIVDNGSVQEGIMEFLQDLKHQNRAYLVLRPENRGWGAAVNDGLGLSRAPFLFLTNNDVEYTIDFHKKMLEVFDNQPNIGILGVWRHTAHGFVGNTIRPDGSVRQGVQNQWFREMDNVPAVGWMLPKSAMQAVGMMTENGPCETKGGNGEDTSYVNRMKEAGYLTGVPAQDLANHWDGY